MRMVYCSVITKAISEKRYSECFYQESNLRPNVYNFECPTTAWWTNEYDVLFGYNTGKLGKKNSECSYQE